MVPLLTSILLVLSMTCTRAWCQADEQVIDLGTATDPAPRLAAAARSYTATTQPLVSYESLAREPADAVLRIRLVKKDAQGTLVDLELDGVELVCLTSRWSCSYHLTKRGGLELGVGKKATLRTLKSNETYTVRGLPLRPQFVLPEIPNGRVAEVALVVDDESLQPPTTRPAAKLATLTGRIVPPPEEKDAVRVLYISSKDASTLPIDSDGAFHGEVRALGGELAVLTRSQGRLTTLYYIPTVKEEKIEVPGNSGLSVATTKKKPVTIQFPAAVLPEGSEVVGVLHSTTSRIPLVIEPIDGQTSVVISMPELEATVVFIGAKSGEFFECRGKMTATPTGGTFVVESVGSLGKLHTKR